MKVDDNVKRFLESDRSLCRLCGEKYKKIGETFLCGMKTGEFYGCDNGHEPQRKGVSLRGKSRYFGGILWSG